MLYLITALLVLYVAIVVITRHLRNTNPHVEQVHFIKDWCYSVFVWSYAKPIVWFVDDDVRNNKKLKKLNEQLSLAGLNEYFTVRSFMAFKAIVLIGSVFSALLLIFSLAYLPMLVSSAPELNMSASNYIAILIFFFMIPLFPNLILKSKVNQRLKEDTKDIPVFQMFVILLIRSNKTVQDILYALSRINSPHKEAFEKGHRMFMRNPKEGISYLRNHFKDSRFSETFSLLDDIGEYPKHECVRILESNLNIIVEETNTIKRRADLTRLIYSQGSLAIPFASLLLLGVFPVIYWGLQEFSKAFSSF